MDNCPIAECGRSACAITHGSESVGSFDLLMGSAIKWSFPNTEGYPDFYCRRC